MAQRSIALEWGTGVAETEKDGDERRWLGGNRDANYNANGTAACRATGSPISWTLEMASGDDVHETKAGKGGMAWRPVYHGWARLPRHARRVTARVRSPHRQYEAAGLELGHTYAFRVRMENAVGQGPWSRVARCRCVRTVHTLS